MCGANLEVDQNSSKDYWPGDGVEVGGVSDVGNVPVFGVVMVVHSDFVKYPGGVGWSQ